VVERIDRSCIWVRPIAVIEAGVSTMGVSAKPPTAARYRPAARAPVTTTSVIGWLLWSCAVACAEKVCRIAQASMESFNSGFIRLLVFARRWASLLFQKAGANWGRANRAGRHLRHRVALSFAGIIQIRYEGYLSPGSVKLLQDP
jgi:hypothetical protein